MFYFWQPIACHDLHIFLSIFLVLNLGTTVVSNDDLYSSTSVYLPNTQIHPDPISTDYERRPISHPILDPIINLVFEISHADSI